MKRGDVVVVPFPFQDLSDALQQKLNDSLKAAPELP